MKPTLACLVMGLLALTPGVYPKQPRSPALSGTEPASPAFATPVRLLAGDAFLGEGRNYPSPVFYDMNDNGILDILVGDLIGRITVAYRIPGEGPARYEKEQPLLDHEGKPLKFDNW